MGGAIDFVIGNTKIATWIKFKQEISDLDCDIRTREDARGLFLEYPRNKKEAFQMMKKNENDDWVLLTCPR
jgi:hypothetical protein